MLARRRTMPDDDAITLLEFVRLNLSAADAAITPTTRLLSEGLVDSMGITLLAAFIEERFGVRFDDTEIRAGGLETIADIARVIAGRR